MLMLQLPPATTVDPHVLVWLNCPFTAILVMFSIPRPVLVSVTVLAALVVKTTWFGNVTEVDERLTAGVTPRPLKETNCGLPEALSLMLTLAVRVPEAAG